MAQSDVMCSLLTREAHTTRRSRHHARSAHHVPRAEHIVPKTKKQSDGLLSFLCYLDKIDAICLFELFNKVINHLTEYTFSAIIDLSTVFAVLAVHNNMIKVLISKMGKSG